MRFVESSKDEAMGDEAEKNMPRATSEGGTVLLTFLIFPNGGFPNLHNRWVDENTGRAN